MQKVITISIPRGEYPGDFPFLENTANLNSGYESKEIEKLLEEGYLVVDMITSDGEAEVFMTFFLEKPASAN